MRNYRQHLRAIVLLTLLVAALTAHAQDDRTTPIRELARKIVSHVQARSAVSLTARNISKLSGSDFSAAQRDLETQLRAQNIRFVKAEQAVETVRVTLSETTTGLLWIAEIGHGGTRDVVMVPARYPESSPRVAAGGVSVHRTLFWKQSQQMLDAASVAAGSARAILVLEPERIVFRSAPEAATHEFVIAHSRPWPRDVRGRLYVMSDATFEAQLPGVRCSGNWQNLSTTNCVESDDPWTLGSLRAFYNSSHNFFTGSLASTARESAMAPFFSVAELSPGGAKLYAFNGVDGRTRIVADNGQTVGSVAGWGSDIAAVSAECGSGRYLLVTRVSDSAHADTIQAFDVVNREPVEASAPTEVPGPVVALWSGLEVTSATAIVENIKTSEYEAYSLKIDCGR